MCTVLRLSLSIILPVSEDIKRIAISLDWPVEPEDLISKVQKVVTEKEHLASTFEYPSDFNIILR